MSSSTIPFLAFTCSIIVCILSKTPPPLPGLPKPTLLDPDRPTGRTRPVPPHPGFRPTPKPNAIPWDYSIMCNCSFPESGHCSPAGVCSASNVGLKLIENLKAIRRAATFYEKGLPGINKTLCRRRDMFEWAIISDLEIKESDLVPACVSTKTKDATMIRACSLTHRNQSHTSQAEIALRIGQHFEKFSCHTADQPLIEADMEYCTEDYCTSTQEAKSEKPDSSEKPGNGVSVQQTFSVLAVLILSAFVIV